MSHLCSLYSSFVFYEDIHHNKDSAFFRLLRKFVEIKCSINV